MQYSTDWWYENHHGKRCVTNQQTNFLITFSVRFSTWFSGKERQNQGIKKKCRQFIVHNASLTCNPTWLQHTLQSPYNQLFCFLPQTCFCLHLIYWIYFINWLHELISFAEEVLPYTLKCYHIWWFTWLTIPCKIVSYNTELVLSARCQTNVDETVFSHLK